MALFQHLLHVTNFGSPLLREWLPAFGVTSAIQAVFGVPSVIAQSELFYDVSASLTFLSVIPLSMYLPYLRAAASRNAALPNLLTPFVGYNAENPRLNWRQLTLSAAASIWACKMGYHLFSRALTNGGDSRFDEIKKSPQKYTIAWVGQTAWITFAILPVVALNSVPASAFAALPTRKLTDYVGLALYVIGLSFEVIADLQKSRWLAEKRNKVHDEQFLTRGLWGQCRFPNYFGEVTLWTGIATVAAGVLVTHPVRAALGWSGGLLARVFAMGLPYSSPAFVSFLLFKISGIPLSEKKYDEKYGDREDYQRWKEKTPRFFPKIS